jgi:hypothetical protein
VEASLVWQSRFGQKGAKGVSNAGHVPCFNPQPSMWPPKVERLNVAINVIKNKTVPHQLEIYISNDVKLRFYPNLLG